MADKSRDVTQVPAGQKHNPLPGDGAGAGGFAKVPALTSEELREKLRKDSMGRQNEAGSPFPDGYTEKKK